MDTASSVVESGVHIPVYESIAGNLLRQFEHASSMVSTSTDDEGETYGLFAAVLSAGEVWYCTDRRNREPGRTGKGEKRCWSDGVH